jgi:hypothetical protein
MLEFMHSHPGDKRKFLAADQIKIRFLNKKSPLRHGEHRGTLRSVLRSTSFFKKALSVS